MLTSLLCGEQPRICFVGNKLGFALPRESFWGLLAEPEDGQECLISLVTYTISEEGERALTNDKNGMNQFAISFVQWKRVHTQQVMMSALALGAVNVF